MQEHDLSRNWYFLSDLDSELLRTSPVGNTYEEFVPRDIKEGLNAYARNMEDIRQGLEIQDRFDHKKIAEASGADIEYYSLNPTDRGLRLVGTTEGTSRSSWGGYEQGHSEETDQEMYQSFNHPGGGIYTNLWDDPRYAENDYLLKDVWFNSFKNLLNTQRIAAENSKYDTYFPHASSEKAGKQTPWSAQWTDPSHEYPTALYANVLQEQLDSIDLLEDRNQIEKNYLSNKSINRYWLNQITQRGGGDAVFDFLDEYRGGRFWMADDIPKYWMSNDASNIARDMFPNQETVSGLAMRVPWQNEGDGILPSDFNFTNLSAENQNENTYYKVFSTEIRRRFESSRTSVEHTGQMPDFSKFSYDADRPSAEEQRSIDQARDFSMADSPFLVPDGKQIFVNDEWKDIVSSHIIPNTGKTQFEFRDGSTAEFDDVPVKFRDADFLPEALLEREREEAAKPPEPTEPEPKPPEPLTDEEESEPLKEEEIEAIVRKHVEDNVIHHVREGKSEFEYDGEIFGFDELLGDEEAEYEGDQEPTVLENLQDYLWKEHHIRPTILTEENIPFIEFRDTVPVLYGDSDLRSTLQLDEHTRAIQADNGVIHQFWTPQMSAIPTEGWEHD